MAMQVFYWGAQSHTVEDRTYYKSFSLNGVTYTVGECVYLFPEDETLPHYIGRVTSAFVDLCSPAQDPHCIEVKWFERRVNLEPSLRGAPDKDKEVVELEETDVNPIGCISGKCSVVKARTFEEAFQQMRGQCGDWYFCRGVFRQQLNSFVLYRDIAAAESLAARRQDKRALVTEYTSPEDVADSDEVADVRTKKDIKEQEYTRQRKGLDRGAAVKEAAQCHVDTAHQSLVDDARDTADAAPIKRRATGRVCQECGATSTPQWREGPAGPKTLCNACGVRYCRAQQRANKRASQQRLSHVPPPQRPNFHSQKAKAKAEQQKILECLTPVNSAPGTEEPSILRPLRQAAVLAASRTAAFARTGVFPFAEDDQNVEARRSNSMQRLREHPTSHDSSHVSTDSAEEVVFTPPGGQPERVGQLTSTHRTAPQTSAAAHKLMKAVSREGTSSFPSLKATLASFPALSEPLADAMVSAEADIVNGSELASPSKGDFVSIVAGAAKYNPAFSVCDDVLEHLENIKHQLPAATYNKLIEVTEVVALAVTEAASADASVSAVSKVLAARQAVASRAKESVVDATSKLKEYMNHLLNLHPLKRESLEDPLLSLEDATVAESFAAVLN